ncbi:hypothetical protein F383_19543 [Gossypium arboreum]|uniref:Uncharacterized protein n=1 Tax=Gossypium arboreum TaxID=29729 RepID=A0A0B0NT09_GOSAR|nr:hypothetical protein F383_19543 [Gossypium arboreum]
MLMVLFTCDIHNVAYLNPEWIADYICVTCTL